jgi:DNA primase
VSRRIPKAFISDLIARADLLDVIGTRVQLKKSGSNHKGLCPFHDEKTPSFTIRPDKGFYKCFGCGAYGNAIDFLMQYENRPFPEAVEILAEMLRLEIPYEGDAAPAERHDDLYAVLEDADAVFRQQLREHAPAIGYLKARGIDGATAARFGLGFAPDAWDTLTEPARQDPNRLDCLIGARLAVRSEGGRVYDRFRNRITFPIRDTRGRVIGFGGRVLGDDEPKYLNSPDTPLFDKSRTLYGLFEARQAPGRPDALIVVEGYMDVIALAQSGVGPAIATMGTATTADNARQLTRLGDRVVFCFDGDRAGRAAAWRALESVLPFGGGNVEIGFVLLPDGEDPDSFVRSRGSAAFADLIAGAAPLSSFLLAEARMDLDLSHADGKARLIARLRPLLTKLARGLYRELVTAEVAAAVGMAPEGLEQALERSDAPPSAPAPAMPRPVQRSTVMRKLLTLALHYPVAAARVGPIEGLDRLEVPGAELLRSVLSSIAADPNTNAAALVEAFRDDPEGRYLRDLAAVEPLDSGDKAADVIREGIAQLVLKQRQAEKVAEFRERTRKL